MNFDRYYDPPEYSEVIALKCTKCGRFISPTPVRHDSVALTETDLDGKIYSYREGWAVYKCSHCGEIPEGKVKEICV